MESRGRMDGCRGVHATGTGNWELGTTCMERLHSENDVTVDIHLLVHMFNRNSVCGFCVMIGAYGKALVKRGSLFELQLRGWGEVGWVDMGRLPD